MVYDDYVHFDPTDSARAVAARVSCLVSQRRQAPHQPARFPISKANCQRSNSEPKNSFLAHNMKLQHLTEKKSKIVVDFLIFLPAKQINMFSTKVNINVLGATLLLATAINTENLVDGFILTSPLPSSHASKALPSTCINAIAAADILAADAELHDDGAIIHHDESFSQSRFFFPSIVERVLIGQETDDIDALQLLHRIDMSFAEREGALEALHSNDSVITVPALSGEECHKLRMFIDKSMKNDGIDDTDGCPDYQINVSMPKLERLVGKQALLKLLEVPMQLEEGADPSNFDRVGIFLRMYRRDQRPWMPFHIDGNKWTINVALNSDEEYENGRLLALHNGKVERVERPEAGLATCHRGSVVHGVSAIGEGTRYSLIMFVHAKH